MGRLQNWILNEKLLLALAIVFEVAVVTNVFHLRLRMNNCLHFGVNERLRDLSLHMLSLELGSQVLLVEVLEHSFPLFDL